MVNGDAAGPERTQLTNAAKELDLGADEARNGSKCYRNPSESRSERVRSASEMRRVESLCG
jgi:hypothetical protein